MTMAKLAEYVAKTVMTALSLFCLIAIPGAFVQAILLVFILLIICAVLSIYGHLQIALLNIFILCVAQALCPLSDVDGIYEHYILASISLGTLSIAFLGVGVGIYRLQRKQTE